jgi:hypothetical protein
MSYEVNADDLFDAGSGDDDLGSEGGGAIPSPAHSSIGDATDNDDGYGAPEIADDDDEYGAPTLDYPSAHGSTAQGTESVSTATVPSQSRLSFGSFSAGQSFRGGFSGGGGFGGGARSRGGCAGVDGAGGPSRGGFSSFNGVGGGPRGPSYLSAPIVNPMGGPPHARGYQTQQAPRFGGGGAPSFGQHMQQSSFHQQQHYKQMDYRPSVRQDAAMSRGPQVHPDRLRNIPRPAQADPPAELQERKSRPKTSAASILPDSDLGLRSKVLAEAEKNRAAGQAASRRKRPGGASLAARKRQRLEEEERLLHSSLETSLEKQRSDDAKAAAAAKKPAFKSLLEMGAGVVASRKAGALQIPRSSPTASKASDRDGSGGGSSAARPRPSGPLRRTPLDVYKDATMTKDVVDREARIQAEREGVEDAEYAERRQKERNHRKFQAHHMRKVPTVSQSMRDSHLVHRFERNLFGVGKDGKPVSDGFKKLGLVPKEIGTDPATEKLWTIVIEEF